MKPEDKIVRGFGLCGFLTAAAMGVYFSFYAVSLSPPLEKALGLVTIVLCPPSLMAVLRIDCEGAQQLVFWVFIALFNCGLYAAVGFFISWVQRIDASTPR